MNKIRVYERSRFATSTVLHDSHGGTLTGRLAIKLAEQYGIIAGIPDGSTKLAG